jgi:hypothetical protein
VVMGKSISISVLIGEIVRYLVRCDVAVVRYFALNTRCWLALYGTDWPGESALRVSIFGTAWTSTIHYASGIERGRSFKHSHARGGTETCLKTLLGCLVDDADIKNLSLLLL